MEEERFCLDNTNHIIDLSEDCDKYCLEDEEIVRLLNDFNKENKELKNTNIQEMIERILFLEQETRLLFEKQDMLISFIYSYFYNNHGLVSDEEFETLRDLL